MKSAPHASFAAEEPQEGQPAPEEGEVSWGRSQLGTQWERSPNMVSWGFLFNSFGGVAFGVLVQRPQRASMPSKLQARWRKRRWRAKKSRRSRRLRQCWSTVFLFYLCWCFYLPFYIFLYFPRLLEMNPIDDSSLERLWGFLEMCFPSRMLKEPSKMIDPDDTPFLLLRADFWHIEMPHFLEFKKRWCLKLRTAQLGKTRRWRKRMAARRERAELITRWRLRWHSGRFRRCFFFSRFYAIEWGILVDFFIFF